MSQELAPGQVLGKLTLIEREYIPKLSKWKCRCECGTVKWVREGHLKSGHTRGCGCSKGKVHSNALAGAFERKPFRPKKQKDFYAVQEEQQVR